LHKSAPVFAEVFSLRDLQSSGSISREKKGLPSFAKSAVSVTENSSSPKASSSPSPPEVVVAGALAIDLSCDFVHSTNSADPVNPQLHTSNPATITQTLGGVGHNVAAALHYLGISVRLCSVVADDVAGAAALHMLSNQGLSTAGIETLRGELRTAQYVAMNNTQKDLFMAMADMRIMEKHQHFGTIWQPHLHSCIPKWLVVDANWDGYSLHEWVTAGKACGALIAFEPVSATKSKRLFASTHRSGALIGVTPHHIVNLATPNKLELASMYIAAREAQLFDREDWWQAIDAMGLSSRGSREELVGISNVSLVDEGVPQQTIQLLPFIPSIVTKLGDKGVLLTQLLRPDDARLKCPTSAPYILSRSHTDNKTIGGIYMRLFPPVEHVTESQIENVNGVGDTFLGVILAGLLASSTTKLDSLIDIAQRGSVMTLKSSEAVSPEISHLRPFLATYNSARVGRET
jgi:pseudouridine-5'-phosphate glycosidase/pseudouridine kinase